ncbi:MAG TPA: hypothetical protein VID51_08075 [Solirubrobacterales bacterium]|jgi:SecD/SecF fusion protein
MRRSTFLLAALAVVFGVALALGGSGSDAAGAPCSVEPGVPSVPSLELEYVLQAGEERVTPRTRDQAVAIVCARLRALGIAGGEVRPLGRKRIRVVLSGPQQPDGAQRVAARLGAAGQLGFYDWEANLIGPEWAIGGEPGRAPKGSALRRAKREWRVAGRPFSSAENAGLILSGAFPSAYGAVKLASRQEPRTSCPDCTASGPRFYMFDRSAAHELLAGPVAKRADLRGTGDARRDGIVLVVPIGTTIVSEQPTDELGEVLTAGEPGWYALKDRPALTAVDIVNPRQESAGLGQPNVTFAFTAKGRVAFERVTREIAFRGQARASGRVSSREAERLSGRFAVVFDHEVKTRPIINFAENPNGIDGRTGAQISGGFTSFREAKDLAAILRTGSLPVSLKLTRQRTLPTQNS